ncbi:hypothetical protein ABMB67_001840 [Halalkalibacter oceani]
MSVKGASLAGIACFREYKNIQLDSRKGTGSAHYADD